MIKRIVVALSILLILATVFFILATTMYYFTNCSQEEIEPSLTQDDLAIAGQLKYAQNLYRAVGANGEALIYIKRWPEYAEYIMSDEDIDFVELLAKEK